MTRPSLRFLLCLGNDSHLQLTTTPACMDIIERKSPPNNLRGSWRTSRAQLRERSLTIPGTSFAWPVRSSCIRMVSCRTRRRYRSTARLHALTAPECTTTPCRAATCFKRALNGASFRTASSSSTALCPCCCPIFCSRKPSIDRLCKVDSRMLYTNNKFQRNSSQHRFKLQGRKRKLKGDYAS